MYRGNNHVEIGQEIVGENISFTHITSYTQDYDRDEKVPVTSTIIINSQVSDLSKQDRDLLEGQYDLNKMLKLHLPKGSTIDVEDSFSRNGHTYTIVQSSDNFNYRVVFCTYDQRL